MQLLLGLRLSVDVYGFCQKYVMRCIAAWKCNFLRQKLTVFPAKGLQTTTAVWFGGQKCQNKEEEESFDKDYIQLYKKKYKRTIGKLFVAMAKNKLSVWSILDSVYRGIRCSQTSSESPESNYSLLMWIRIYKHVIWNHSPSWQFLYKWFNKTKPNQ